MVQGLRSSNKKRLSEYKSYKKNKETGKKILIPISSGDTR